MPVVLLPNVESRAVVALEVSESALLGDLRVGVDADVVLLGEAKGVGVATGLGGPTPDVADAGEELIDIGVAGGAPAVG